MIISLLVHIAKHLRAHGGALCKVIDVPEPEGTGMVGPMALYAIL